MQIFLATRNAHKVEEIKSLLGPAAACRSAAELTGPISVEESAGTFAGNAALKATRWARALAESPDAERWPDDPEGERWVLADDSGLEVDFLGGAPGVHSARFAAAETGGGNSPDSANNAKLLALLREVPWLKRTARFRCALALTPVVARTPSASPACALEEAGLRTEIFEGICEGKIALAPRGANGFGYDPLFIPERYELSFGELGEAVKNKISHRARAFAQLRKWIVRA